jgi:formyl-CoA transferase
MQAVHPRLSATPGRIEGAGPTELGGDNADVYGALGIDPDELRILHDEGVI